MLMLISIPVHRNIADFRQSSHLWCRRIEAWFEYLMENDSCRSPTDIWDEAEAMGQPNQTQEP